VTISQTFNDNARSPGRVRVVFISDPRVSTFMSAARWTAVLFVALAVARPGSAEPKPVEAPAPTVAPASRDDADVDWWDPLVGERIGLFNAARDEAAEEDGMLASLGYLQGYGWRRGTLP
jgi:hypothetical protein